MVRTWWDRNWKWAVPVGVLGGLICIAAFTFTIVLAVLALFKSSDVYAEAVHRARSSPGVVRELGEPIEPGWWVIGNINITGSSGTADFATPISGPSGRGTLYAEARKKAGRWTFGILEVAVDGKADRIELLETEP